MNNEEIKKELMYLAKQVKLDEEGLQEHVDFCILRGLKEFWNAKPWSFRTREYILTITEEADSYVLPDDFEGIISIKETASQSGRGLIPLFPEEFDRLVPKQSAHQSNYPVWVAFFKNKTDQKWYAKFFPIPVAGYTIPMLIVTSAANDVEQVPDSFSEGLVLAIMKHLYKPGTYQRTEAFKAYQDKILELERGDTPIMEITERQTESDGQVILRRPWQ